jgi:hypothetical protein
MRSATVTTVLDAPRDAVFSFLADIDNLPRWATEFARELRHEGGRHIVVNGLGEFVFDVRADERTGVIDMFAGPSEDELAVFPTRAIALADGRTAYTFTMFQGPGMPDELFEAQHASLVREFRNIERHFFGGRTPEA